MAFNFADAAKIDLTIFGSLVTEMPPPSLPHGVSPDNQDVQFVPGGVGSRQALQKVFGTPFPAGGPNNQVPTVVYGKSFVQPNGDIENLYLDSNGILWHEDFTNSPGTYTQLGTTMPGSYAKSSTAFGREYIAISDGLHGTEMPLQYDGTNLDRVTMDGPGAAPSVASVALPAATISAGTPLASLAVTEADPTTDIPPFGFYTSITFWTSSSVAGIQPGMKVTITGNSSSAMNVTATIVSIATGGTTPGYETAIFLNYYSPPGTLYGLGGTATVSGAAVTRSNNIVTVGTAAAHNLQPGYLVQIANLPATAIANGAGAVSSIVINNENLPGLATVTVMLAAGQASHGLKPGCLVSMTGIKPTTLDSSSTATRVGGIVTITTSGLNDAAGNPINLVPGALVTLSGFSDASFDAQVAILSVALNAGGTAIVFTFAQVTDADVTTPATGGTVVLNWPIPDTDTPTFYEVVSCPSATTFQVQLAYSDGTWGSGGTVTFGWNGTFYVLTVPSATSFTYRQYGPDAQASLPMSPVATATPFGQAAPGLHQLQVSFLTRQGYITRPSPPVQFMANGGQYLSIANIAIGPPNVIGRILEFTGAGGAFFFYIPAIPQVNGQIVGTATQINDNTTTNVLLDFSDNTLFASIANSIQGNDLAAQIKLDGALGFGFYGSRLVAYGQRNCVQNFLNIGFDGGYLPSQSPLNPGWTAGTYFPSGWQFSGSVPGVALDLAGRFNTFNARFVSGGSIFQSAFQDAYGVPILSGNTQYIFRAWLEPSVVGQTLTAKLSSVIGGFTLTAAITGAGGVGSWQQEAFSGPTPNNIPSDTILTLSASGGGTIETADVQIIFSETPYTDTVLNGSYVNNPEAFDGVTGVFGPTDDTHKVMDFGIIRSTMYIGTQDPSGRIHETFDNGTTEPAGWAVSQVAANCGLLSAFCMMKSQADDQAAGGGEEWFAWASSTGALIFSGREPDKISQEIQPDWVGGSNGQLSFAGINPAAYLTVWAINDWVNRIMYFGLPIGTATAPSLIYPLSCRELGSAEAIAAAAPFHPSFSGHLIATDNTRKWTRWNMAMNGAAMMYRTAGQLSLVLFGGNAKAPGTIAGYGNVYQLTSTLLTDDDYGAIAPYYVTYFFVNRQDEAMLRDDKGKPIGFGRKVLAYQTAFISGVGTLTITAFCDSMTNPWPLTCTRQLAANPTFDQEWTGGMAQAQRIALKFASSAAL